MRRKRQETQEGNDRKETTGAQEGNDRKHKKETTGRKLQEAQEGNDRKETTGAQEGNYRKHKKETTGSTRSKIGPKRHWVRWPTYTGQPVGILQQAVPNPYLLLKDMYLNALLMTIYQTNSHSPLN